jgi:DNA-binding beta-propeller fold protein YncE
MSEQRKRRDKAVKAKQEREDEKVMAASYPYEFSFTVFRRVNDYGQVYYTAVPSDNVTRDGQHALPEPFGHGLTPYEALIALLAKLHKGD